MSPSEAEVEAKKTLFRRLGAKELQRRLNDHQIGGFGSWEHRVAREVLWELAAEKEARRPTANGNKIRLGAFLLVATVLVLKILGIF